MINLLIICVHYVCILHIYYNFREFMSLESDIGKKLKKTTYLMDQWPIAQILLFLVLGLVLEIKVLYYDTNFKLNH